VTFSLLWYQGKIKQPVNGLLLMKKLARISFFALVAGFAFASCETKNTENATENAGEAIEADADASADSLDANTDQAVEATEDAADAAATEVKEETNEAAAEVKN
jgi:hypothetical protein